MADEIEVKNGYAMFLIWLSILLNLFTLVETLLKVVDMHLISLGTQKLAGLSNIMLNLRFTTRPAIDIIEEFSKFILPQFQKKCYSVVLKV